MLKRTMAAVLLLIIIATSVACTTTKGKVIMGSNKTAVPVPTVDPSKFTTSVGEYVTIFNDTLLAMIALDKTSVDIGENLNIALVTEGLSDYPDSYIQVVPSSMPHLAIFNMDTYASTYVKDIKYTPYPISTSGLEYGDYDIRVFDGDDSEVGYISFVVEVAQFNVSAKPTLPPLDDGYKFKKDERLSKLLYTTVNSNIHAVKYVYQTTISGESTLVTQYEYKGDTYFTYGPDDNLTVYLVKDGKCYVLLSEVKRAVVVDPPVFPNMFSFSDFVYTDRITKSSCTQTLVTTEYSCDDMYLDDTAFYRFYFDSSNKLCYIQLANKQLVKILSYEVYDGRSVFTLPDDYERVNIAG